LHTYARYATAYRAGGFNLLNSNLSPFDPEKLTSYELGLKSLMDRQADAVEPGGVLADPTTTCSSTSSTPATQQVYTLKWGQAKFDGVEGEFEFLPIDALRISADVPTWTRGNSGEIVNPFTQTPVFGTSLPNAPEWKYNAAVEYFFPAAQHRHRVADGRVQLPRRGDVERRSGIRGGPASVRPPDQRTARAHRRHGRPRPPLIGLVGQQPRR
jgi:outer membrane receptor protein involved in Fe transport